MVAEERFMASDEFDRATAPYRRELLAHCYQMLGSVHDAEDLVQDTLLRAWRSYDRFDARRASIRTWLHRIATNACLTELRNRASRPLPSGLGAPSDDPRAPMAAGPEIPWLEPIADAQLGAHSSDPAAAILARGQLRLAFITAMQVLPARQRAILVMRDVLELPIADVAAALGATPAAVNSGLQRARTRLAELGVDQDAVTEPSSADQRAVVDRYVAAFVAADLNALAQMLTDDVVLEMPPVLNWYVGRDSYVQFMARAFQLRGTDWRMLPASANGQPALAAYVRGGESADGYEIHSLQVLSIAGSRVSRNTNFVDRAAFTSFGIAHTLP
jgi:RNA polymerase sigma-70 factor (ECF subfamily)